MNTIYVETTCNNCDETTLHEFEVESDHILSDLLENDCSNCNSRNTYSALIDNEKAGE